MVNLDFGLNVSWLLVRLSPINILKIIKLLRTFNKYLTLYQQ